jgi:hypothetical protein
MSGQGAPQRWDVEPFTELKTTARRRAARHGARSRICGGAALYLLGHIAFFRSRHGAAQTHFMPHLAMLEVDDEGNSATWGDHVRDEEYEAAPRIDNGQPM